MDTQSIIANLEAERNRLDEAIRALRGDRRGPGRPRTAHGTRRMSAAARKRISEAQKKRWAAQKKAGR